MVKITSEYDVLKTMSKIKVGYVDRSGLIYHNIDINFRNKYVLQMPNELLSSQCGLSFDQVELERELLRKLNYNVYSYAIIHKNREVHSFVVYVKENKYYWLENYWFTNRGIHEYNDLNELYNDVINKYSKSIKNFDINQTKIYEYNQFNKKLNFIELISDITKQVEVMHI